MNKFINFSEVNPISNKQNLIIKNQIFSTIKKKDFILGKSVNEFEKKFSKLSKIKYSVGCASGTDALILSLMSLNLKKGDEVIVPGMSYISTGLSVILNDNKLVFADIDNKTGLISIDKISKKLTKKTKAIIPVNLYGQKVDLKKLREVVGRKITIIEDSAQSILAYSCYGCSNNNSTKCCKKKMNEKYSDISCYSFYPSKNLGAYGDAGLIATNDKKKYKELLALRNLGAIKRNRFTLIGKNSRLDTIQSIVLMNKIRNVLKWNDSRREISNIYDKNLKDIKEIKLTKTSPGSSRHLYVIRTQKRPKLIKYLMKKKILCQTHYSYSLNQLKPFKKFISSQKLVNSEMWSKECLSLPLYPEMKKSQIYKIIYEVKKFFLN